MLQELPGRNRTFVRAMELAVSGPIAIKNMEVASGHVFYENKSGNASHH